MPGITWRVVRYAGPSPAENPSYRGGPDGLAVLGDTIRVQTTDGVLEGEIVGVLQPQTRAFYLLTERGEVYLVSHRAIARLDDDL